MAGTSPASTHRGQHLASWQYAVAWSRGLHQDMRMPIYELDGIKPEFPDDGSYWIAETAVVIGKVRLKHDTSIWYGAVLRGDNEWIELREGLEIQDNTSLHTDPDYPTVIGDKRNTSPNTSLHENTMVNNSG